MGNDSDDILFWYEAPIAGITGIEDIISTEIVVIVLECMIDDGITGRLLDGTIIRHPITYKTKINLIEI